MFVGNKKPKGDESVVWHVQIAVYELRETYFLLCAKGSYGGSEGNLWCISSASCTCPVGQNRFIRAMLWAAFQHSFFRIKTLHQCMLSPMTTLWLLNVMYWRILVCHTFWHTFKSSDTRNIWRHFQCSLSFTGINWAQFNKFWSRR